VTDKGELSSEGSLFFNQPAILIISCPGTLSAPLRIMHMEDY